MKYAPDSVPVRNLTLCCPEAQADGVPCTSLGRNCEDCEHAVAIPAPPIRGADPSTEDDR